MIAIFTRYLGPTNHRGSRYRAQTADGRRVTVAANYAIDASDNHARAARVLARRIGLAPCTLARFGDTPDRKGYVFAIIERVTPDGAFGPAHIYPVETTEREQEDD